jgi:hypothetical protein
MESGAATVNERQEKSFSSLIEEIFFRDWFRYEIFIFREFF